MQCQASQHGMEWPKEVSVVYGCLAGLTKQEAQRQFLTLVGKKAYGELLCHPNLSHNPSISHSWIA